MIEEELKEFISPDTEIKAISMENIKIIYNLIEKQQKEIEKLRIKNGKEFARGLETNEKSWKAKINAMQDEYFEKVKHYDCDTADWKQSQYMGSYSVLHKLLKGE